MTFIIRDALGEKRADGQTFQTREEALFYIRIYYELAGKRHPELFPMTAEEVPE